MKHLDANGSARSAVTIIGTKYCAGAFGYIAKASRSRESEEQCLFLVMDPKTEEVMLHNGKQRLGTVAPIDLPRVSKLLKHLAEEGVDQVLVCKIAYISTMDEGGFSRNSSFNVVPQFSVYERLARKFSTKYRKE